MHNIDKEYLKDLKRRLISELAANNASGDVSSVEEADSKEALSYCLEKALKAIQTSINCLTLIDMQEALKSEEIVLDA